MLVQFGKTHRSLRKVRYERKPKEKFKDGMRHRTKVQLIFRIAQISLLLTSGYHIQDLHVVIHKLPAMSNRPTCRMSDLVKGGQNPFSNKSLKEVKAEMELISLDLRLKNLTKCRGNRLKVQE